jgi:hypothetical protein
METEANGGAAELSAPSFCAPAEPAGRFMEMTCVYALGPLEGAGWMGEGSLTGRLSAFVAPSEGVTFGATGCFSITGFGRGGIEKAGGAGSGTMGGVGVTYDAGCGGTKGSCTGEGKADELSVIGRGSPPDGGAPAMPEVRDSMLGLLSHPVNPAPGDSLPATPASGDGSSRRGELNIAVNSPTDFRGGSTGSRDMAGIFDGPSTRNGL